MSIGFPTGRHRFIGQLNDSDQWLESRRTLGLGRMVGIKEGEVTGAVRNNPRTIPLARRTANLNRYHQDAAQSFRD